jgi:dipeptidyl aminopeptidase/acylaminoacyl peptidase
VDVTYLAWRDEQHLFFAGQRGLTTVYGDVDPASGEARELWSTPETSGFHAPDAAPLPNGAFAVALHSYTRYPELLVVRDGTTTSIVSLAHAGSDYQIQIGGTIEPVRWTAPDGLEIEGLLVRPTAPEPFPLIVHVHGGPVWSYRNRWSLGETTRPLVSRGYAILHPNPRGSTGRGQAFAEAVYGDMGGADVDDIFSGIDALIARGIADPARLGVMGTSYGGFMSSLLIGRTDRFGAAVSMSPVNEWRSMHFTTYFPDFDVLFLQDDPYHAAGQYDARSPLMFARNIHTPTLHTAGGHDEATPASQAIAFHHALLENGVESVLVLYPEEGHGVRHYPAIIDVCTRIIVWFERFIPPHSQAT